MYTLCLLCLANGQMQVCLIAYSVKIITKSIAVITDTSQPGWFHVETYIMHFLGLIQLVLKSLSSEYDDRLKDRFILIDVTSYKDISYNIMLELNLHYTLHLHLFLPEIYLYNCLFVSRNYC